MDKWLNVLAEDGWLTHGGSLDTIPSAYSGAHSMVCQHCEVFRAHLLHTGTTQLWFLAIDVRLNLCSTGHGGVGVGRSGRMTRITRLGQAEKKSKWLKTMWPQDLLLVVQYTLSSSPCW